MINPNINEQIAFISSMVDYGVESLYLKGIHED